MCDKAAAPEPAQAWRALVSQFGAEGLAEELQQAVAIGVSECATWAEYLSGAAGKAWEDYQQGAQGALEGRDVNLGRQLVLLEVDKDTADRLRLGGQLLAPTELIRNAVEAAWSSGHREGLVVGRREGGQREAAPALRLVHGSTAQAEVTYYIAGLPLRTAVKAGQPELNEHDRQVIADKLRRQSRSLGQILCVASDPYGHVAGAASLEDAPGIDDTDRSYADVLVEVTTLAKGIVQTEASLADAVGAAEKSKAAAEVMVAELLEEIALLTGRAISTAPTAESVDRAKAESRDWRHGLANKIGAVAGALEILAEVGGGIIGVTANGGRLLEMADRTAAELVELVRGFTVDEGEVANG